MWEDTIPSTSFSAEKIRNCLRRDPFCSQNIPFIWKSYHPRGWQAGSPTGTFLRWFAFLVIPKPLACVKLSSLERTCFENNVPLWLWNSKGVNNRLLRAQDMLRHSPLPLAWVAQALWPGSYHKGITALFLLLRFLSEERNSYIKTFPGSRHLPAADPSGNSLSPLPSHIPSWAFPGPRCGQSSEDLPCRCWLTSKQKLPLDKKPHSAIGNLFVLGGAFFLSVLSHLQTPTAQSLLCWLCSFLPFFFFFGYVLQSIFKQ